jgi:RHS repeat-associated protein
MKKSILTLCLCPLNSISKTLSACFLLGTSVLLAQDTIPTAVTPMNNTGDLPYSTTIGTDIEHVDLASGNLIVTIPFVSVPGRKMSFDFGIRFDARFWVQDTHSDNRLFWNVEMRNWLTANTVGWTPTQGYLTYSFGQAYCVDNAGQEPVQNGSHSSILYSAGGVQGSGYIFTDRNGYKHSFAVNKFTSGECLTTVPAGNPFDSSNYVAPSYDMDGYYANLDGLYPTIQGPDGTYYYSGGVSGGTSRTTLGQYFVDFAAEADLRGNSQIVSPGGTDSIGRTIVTQITSANQIVYLIHDSNGSLQPYTVNLEPIQISTQFGNTSIHEYSATRQVVSSVVLPNQQSYSFQYDSWGHITQIVEPNGAIINYQWETTGLSAAGGGVFRAVTQRTVIHDGVSDTWTLSYSPITTSSTGALSDTVTVTYPPNTNGTQAQTIYSYDQYQHLIKMQYLASPAGAQLRQFELTWDQSVSIPESLNPASHLASIQTTLENGLVSKRTFQHDLYAFPYQILDCGGNNYQFWLNCWILASGGATINGVPFNPQPPTYLPPMNVYPGTHGNVTTIQEYDWGQGAPSQQPVRQTIRKYLQDTNSNYFFANPFTTGTNGGASMRNITNRVVRETIYDGSVGCTGTGTWADDGNGTITPPPACQANMIAQTVVTYDQNAPSTYGYYGEATAISHWLNSPSSTMLTSSYTYDGHGNILTATDPRNYTTTYGYSDAWAGSSNCAASSPANAYLTSVTNALNQQSTQSYYECTGKLATYKNANDLAAGNRETAFSYDWMGRTTLVSYPNGGHTATAFNDSAHTIDVQQLIVAGKTHEALTQLDHLGRAVQTQLLSDPQGVTYATTSYDALGRKYQVSNPYRSTSDSTYGTTTFGYDALGRMTSQIDSDGVSTQTWAYSGNTVTHTDESGNQWRQAKDALGRLTKVFEPNGLNAAPSMETDYTYDVLGNLLTVAQTGMTGVDTPRAQRTFTYDSLSRLLTAFNPESGSTSYSYDANANVLTKSSPAVNTSSGTQTIGYCYDGLNRATYKLYSAPPSSCTSPSGYVASYTYDTSSISGSANTIGRLTDEIAYIGGTPISERSPYNYDAMGRLRGELQTPYAPSSTSYAFSYTYDLAGDVTQFNNGLPVSTSTTAPGIVWQASYDGAARLSQLQAISQPWGTAGTPDPAHPPFLLNNLLYDASSHIVSEQAGLTTASGTPSLGVVSSYDNRERITSEIGSGSVLQSSPTGSIGVITISGTEASGIGSQATHGSIVLTIGGENGYVLNCGGGEGMYLVQPEEGEEAFSSSAFPQGCTKFYNSGDISATINGFTSDASYGENTPLSAMVMTLAQNFNRSGSPVTATYSGNTVTVTANATGTASNYPITLSYGSDFTISVPSGTLTGGQNSATVYDAGTLTATITNNSVSPAVSYTTAAVSWGQGDSSGTVAIKLASAINTAVGSLVTASASGATINLVSTAAGANTNYSVTASVTDTMSASYPSLFPSPSFTASDTSMSGGSTATTGYGPVYTYAVPPPTSTTGYASNGNLLSYTDSVMGTWNFGYDTLNRLTTAQNTATTSVSTQFAGMYGCWTYDGFGNRTAESWLTTACPSSLTPTAAYNGSNRMTWTSVNAAGSNMQYDGAGNVLFDGANSYAYDPEGRLCAVRNTATGGPAYTAYIYGADGTRVAKLNTGSLISSSGNLTCWTPSVSNTLQSQYLLGLGGEQVTELDGGSNWKHTNVWAGGKLLATYDASGLHFPLTDPLGSKRIQANAAGVVDEICSSLPYGNFLSCSGDDATEHHFTGKERDTESGNDLMGARYYASAMGRFLSPDPIYIAEHRLADPQLLNLYQYGRNNPLRYTDSTGLDVNLDCSQVSSEACNKTVGDLNNRKDAQFTVSRNDKTGLLQVDGKVDPSKLSSGEAALYGAISDTDHHATLSVVSESGDVQFGKFDGNGHNTLDRSDLNLLGNASPQAAGEVVAHEALEAYDSSFGGVGYAISHAYANQFFGEATNPFAGRCDVCTPAWNMMEWNMGRINQSFLVKTVIKTPVPDANMHGGYEPGKIVSVKKLDPQ